MAMTETAAFNLALQRLLSDPQQHSTNTEVPVKVTNTASNDVAVDSARPAELAAVRSQIIQLAAQSEALALAAHATRCDVARAAALHETFSDDAADALVTLDSAISESTAALDRKIGGMPWGHADSTDIYSEASAVLDQVREKIQATTTLSEYRDSLLELGDLSIPFALFRDAPDEDESITKRKVSNTTHQDTRDIERDMLCVNGQILVGAKVKYERIVSHMQEALEIARARVLGDETTTTNAIESLNNAQDFRETVKIVPNMKQQAALARFAKVVLNVGNRTNSGGNVFEVMHLSLLPQHLEVLITPDSEAALSPIQVHIDAGAFYSTNPKHTSGGGDGWQWGLRATVIGETAYFITNAMLGHTHGSARGESSDPNTDMHLVKVKGKYVQHLAIRWPPPEYVSQETVDDGKSEFNRQWYTLGGYRFEGDVLLSVLDCDHMEASDDIVAEREQMLEPSVTSQLQQADVHSSNDVVHSGIGSAHSINEHVLNSDGQYVVVSTPEATPEKAHVLAEVGNDCADADVDRLSNTDVSAELLGGKERNDTIERHQAIETITKQGQAIEQDQIDQHRASDQHESTDPDTVAVATIDSSRSASNVDASMFGEQPKQHADGADVVSGWSEDDDDDDLGFDSSAHEVDDVASSTALENHTGLIDTDAVAGVDATDVVVAGVDSTVVTVGDAADVAVAVASGVVDAEDAVIYFGDEDTTNELRAPDDTITDNICVAAAYGGISSAADKLKATDSVAPLSPLGDTSQPDNKSDEHDQQVGGGGGWSDDDDNDQLDLSDIESEAAVSLTADSETVSIKNDNNMTTNEFRTADIVVSGSTDMKTGTGVASNTESEVGIGDVSNINDALEHIEQQNQQQDVQSNANADGWGDDDNGDFGLSDIDSVDADDFR